MYFFNEWSDISVNGQQVIGMNRGHIKHRTNKPESHVRLDLGKKSITLLFPAQSFVKYTGQQILKLCMSASLWNSAIITLQHFVYNYIFIGRCFDLDPHPELLMQKPGHAFSLASHKSTLPVVLVEMPDEAKGIFSRYWT